MTHNHITPFLGAFLLLFSINIMAQDAEQVKYTASNKGKFLISWGGNRESFTNSDITFKGEDYNFTLNNVHAHDKPKGWHLDYINPQKMTIPQTNIKVGYFISDHYLVSIGVDHMKYVINQLQTVKINGDINLPITENGAIYNGNYNNDDILIDEDFLLFEHTNGLNYAYAEFARFDDISSLLNLPNTDKFQINVTEGIGGGILYPKTNTTLLQKDRYDEFHLAGYGISLNAGVNLTFFKHFFLEFDLRSGYINMPDIRTTSNTAESASQDFFYFQRVIAFGGVFRI